jgi:AcrR family transcriptional regulator
LQKLLTAAEEVLVNDGLDDFTVAAVAEQAGVSVGGVYRRFASRETLIDAVVDSMLTRVQDTVAESLNAAEPSLAGVITAFTHALATSFDRSGRVASALATAQRTPEARQRGLRNLTVLQRLFLDAAAPYGDQITRSARSTALTTVLRTIIAAGAHRTGVAQWWPDGLSWAQWADEMADMATTYLTTPQQPGTAARPSRRRTTTQDG